MPDSLNVTGDGVPLTTAQRVATFGARTRPVVRGGLPAFTLSEELKPTYRESVLQKYEALDAKAGKVLRDARSWVLFQLIGAGGAVLLSVLGALSVISLGGAAGWILTGVIITVIGFPYRRHERRKHAALVQEAHEWLDPFVASGKAVRVSEPGEGAR